MNKEFPIRKSTRLQKYDYSAPGAYFITVCTQNRKQILSQIVKSSVCDSDRMMPNNTVGEGSALPKTTDQAASNETVGEGSALPKTALNMTPYGATVDKWIREISNKYSHISVDHYVIMPNHIHLLISVKRPNGRGDPSPTENVEVKSPGVIEAIAWLKYHTTKEIKEKFNTFDIPIWQRSFHDHVIRNEEDYYEVAKYIAENPICWEEDTLYSK